LMPVYDADPADVAAAIESVRRQIYPKWELCIADDASTRSGTLAVLRRYQDDPRIKIRFRAENGHICRASNSAAQLATGDFVALLDHDDLLAEDALLEYARRLEADPLVDVLYSDEDKLSPDGTRYDPHFKPDWSRVLFLGYNYVNHLTCVRRSLFEAVGGFREGYEGAQDYDLLLRVVEKTRRIAHVPAVLYHWRATPASTASAPEVKPFVKQAVDAALRDYLHRNGIPATAYQPALAARHHLPINQLEWPDEGPSVSVIIPTRNQGELLGRCVQSLLEKTTYGAFEIVIVDNASDDEATLRRLSSLAGPRTKVVRIPSGPEGFSFSSINNQAVRSATGDLVLFLNDDTEVIEPRWLSRMVGYSQLPGVGAVGARLLYPDGRVQHGGVVLRAGDSGAPGHAFSGHPGEELSYFFLAETTREVAAVTAACMLTPRRVFEELGGFDEKMFRVSLNDVDYCLRLADRGLACLYVGGAVLLHHESASRSRQDDPSELAHFRRRYRHRRDPYYNPNLSSRRPFAVDPAYHGDRVPLLGERLRALFVVPNLGLEGGPKILTDAARELASHPRFEPTVVAFADGPLRSSLEGAGVRCRVLELPDLDNALGCFTSAAHLRSCVESVARLLRDERPAMVLAATVNSFFVIEAAAGEDIPALWFIQESYSESVLRHVIQPFSWSTWRRALGTAARVVFGSRETALYYEPFRTASNFEVLYNSIDADRVDGFCREVSAAEARRRVAVPDGKRMIVSVGTVCARKNQETIVDAVRELRRRRRDFLVRLVGARPGETYATTLRALVARYSLESALELVEETERVFDHYRAADVFVSSSLIESHSFAILEAMAFGLPIVSTPAAGVREQVRPGLNAMLFPPGDGVRLAEQLEKLLSDDELRDRMGRNSRQVFEWLPDRQETLTDLVRLMEGAWATQP